MTTTIRRALTTFNAIFQWRSLKTRVTILTLAIFLIGIWSFAFYASRLLREDMQRLLSEQQFSTVSIMAAHVNRQLDARLKSITIVAEKITPAMLRNAPSLQKFLENRLVFQAMFNGGVYVTQLDGKAIADVPISTGRIGMDSSDRDWMIEAFKGKTAIGKPIIGKKLQVPVFSIAAPIRDTKGKVIGVLVGVVDLSKPNFLDEITNSRYGKTGGFLVVAPEHRLIITATDRRLIMAKVTDPGTDPLVDRFVQGYEGSGILVNPVGAKVLASSKGVPVAGWYVAAVLPAEEAFAPIHAMQQRMVLATIFLTLLVGALIWWALKRQLAPVFTTIKTLATLSDTSKSLPITRQDEIGELIGGFNHLLETLGQREKALKESEERHRSLFENAPIGIFYSTSEGKISSVNEEYARIMGYGSPEEVKEAVNRSSVAEVLYDKPADRSVLVRQAQETACWVKTERRYRRKDGSSVVANLAFRALPDNPQLIEGFVEDITVRKRAEEALNANEAQLSAALEMACLGHWEYDIATDLFTFNDHFYKIFRTTVGQVGGYTMHSAEYAHRFVHPDDRNLIREEIKKSIETTDPHFSQQLEHRIRYADGTDGYISVRIFVVKDSHGRTIKTNGVNQDITERKRAEGERRQLEEHLQRAEKMEAIGTLAGGVAHDLNNVLGIVVGYAEMLLDEIDESSPLKGDVVKIMEGGKRSAAIVQDLLTLARRGVQTRKVFNLNAAIMDCQKTPEFEKVLSFNPRVQIKTNLEADLLNIVGSPMHLTKTIMNLVANAVEAMTGRGMLTITTSNQSLDAPVHGYDAVNVGDYVVLSIADTGEGIPDSDIKHIFEPFYTKKVMGRSGTGLGLAVVWGTVKDHNGYINVQSEVGKGTTFTLYFPVTREEIATEATIPLSDYIGKDESILVIDDIKEQRELAAKMLGKLNYKVKTVSSGEEAVEYLRTKKADLILLDMIMDPGMDGLDTYKAIIEIHPGQKAIIASGFSETERVKEAKTLGVGDYLRKPYVIEKLGLAVRKELDLK